MCDFLLQLVTLANERELNVIFAELTTTVRSTHIIEVGTWKGQSAITMAKVLRLQSSRLILVAMLTLQFFKFRQSHSYDLIHVIITVSGKPSDEADFFFGG